MTTDGIVFFKELTIYSKGTNSNLEAYIINLTIWNLL